MIHCMETRPYYDAEPWYKREKTLDWYQQMEKTNQAMQELLGEFITKKTTVLEVACGGGWLAEFILKGNVNSYSGFDFSETAITNAKKRLATFEDAKIWRADALSPQIYLKKYNLIISHQFLHCLIGKDRGEWLKKCRSALHSDGVLVFSSMIGIPESLSSAVNPETKVNKPGNRYYADEKEIISEIEAAGFELEHVVHPEDNSAIFVASPVIA